MRRLIALATLVLAHPAKADIATNLTEDNQTYLFYLDGAFTVRTLCPRDAVLFDHATCAKAERRVPTHALFEASGASFGGDLPALQLRLDQLRTGIAHADDRLTQLLNTPTVPNADALKAEIERLSRAAAVAGIEVQDYADQLARLKAAIAGGDTGSEEQLRVTAAAYAGAVKKRSAIVAQMQDASKAYIDAAAREPDSTFRGLLADRKRLTELFAATEHDLDLEVEEAVNLATLYKRLQEPGYTYAHLYADRNYEDTFKVLCGHDFPRCYDQPDAFDRLFRGIDAAARTYNGTASADFHSVSTVIDRDDGVGRVNCTFVTDNVFRPGPCDPVIRVRGPNGYDVTVDANVTSGPWFELTPWDSHGAVSVELWHTLIGARSRGTWTAELACASGAERVYTAASCRFIVERRDLWDLTMCPGDWTGVTPAPCQLHP